MVIAFVFGRYSAPEKIKIEKQTVTVEVEKVKSENQTDLNATVTSIHKPDGTVITRKKISSLTKNSITQNTAKEHLTQEKTEIIKGSNVNVMALGAIDLSSLTRGIVYGVSISRPILGPITIGLFGFSSGIIGISGGLQF